MTRILTALAGWKGYALTAAICLAVGFAQGWTVRGWKADADATDASIKAHAAQLAAVNAARLAEAAQAQTTHRIEAKAAEAQVVIREVTRTLIEEVPVYVTPDVDARFDVPAGFVRLHDAAAAGRAVVPDPAGQSDDAASGLAFSAVATTVVGNYGQCLATARQLTDLQAWVEAQARLAERRDSPP